MFTVEDVMLVGSVDGEKAALLEKEVKEGRAEKALLDSHLNASAVPHAPGLVKLHPMANYRTTLHPSIWKKDYTTSCMWSSLLSEN